MVLETYKKYVWVGEAAPPEVWSNVIRDFGLDLELPKEFKKFEEGVIEVEELFRLSKRRFLTFCDDLDEPSQHIIELG